MTVPLVFLDTETTGLAYDRRPWEIAMIRRDEQIGDRSVLIQVSDVDLSAAELIGLRIGRFHERHARYADGWNTSREARHGDSLRVLPEAEAARLVEQWTRGAHIVGAVPNFDTETLAAMLRRHGMCPAWHYHLIDVETLAVGWLNGLADAAPETGAAAALAGGLPWKSDDLSRACGVEPPSEQERHTAMGDARWAMRLYDRITGTGAASIPTVEVEAGPVSFGAGGFTVNA